MKCIPFTHCNAGSHPNVTDELSNRIVIRAPRSLSEFVGGSHCPNPHAITARNSPVRVMIRHVNIVQYLIATLYTATATITYRQLEMSSGHSARDECTLLSIGRIQFSSEHSPRFSALQISL